MLEVGCPSSAALLATVMSVESRSEIAAEFRLQFLMVLDF